MRPSIPHVFAGSSMRRVAASRTLGRLSSALLTFLALAAGCTSAVRPEPAAAARVESELGQLLLVGFDGTDLPDNAEIERLLCQVRVGGILIFGRNVQD